MEYIYAALLLHSAKKEINEENIKKVLNAAGVEVNEAKVKSLVESLKNINIDDVLNSATAVPAFVPAAQQQEVKKEEKREEKKEEKASDEQAAAGLAALFGL